jgi:diadenosine tetraphosphate (Ap4A) HIT family hydrolase
MTATRSKKEEASYRRHLKTVDRNVCAFCSVDEDSDQFVEGTKYFKILKNIFPYSLWDGQRVVDHLMITPRQHTDSLDTLSLHEKADYVDLLAKYEKNGYNIYARAPQSAIKSIFHQHTHLIKTAGTPRRFVLLVRKPYFRFVR